MKILNVIWSTSMLITIGIVLTENDITGVKTLRCGMVLGFSEKQNSEDIARTGGKINVQELKNMLQQLEKGV